MGFNWAAALDGGMTAYNKRSDEVEANRLKKRADERAQGLHDEQMDAYAWERKGREADMEAGAIRAGERDPAPQAAIPQQATGMPEQLAGPVDAPAAGIPQAAPQQLAGPVDASAPAAGGTVGSTPSTQGVAPEAPEGALPAPSKNAKAIDADRARRAAKVLHKAGRSEKAEAMEAKADQFEIERDVSEVGDFIMKGGTEEQFVEKFLKGVSDSKSNPFKAYVVSGPDGSKMIAAIDPNGSHRVRSMRDMVNEYIGVIHMTKGKPEKYLNATKEEREEMHKQAQFEQKNTELAINDKKADSDDRYKRDLIDVYKDKNLTNLEIAELRAANSRAQRANMEVKGATEDGRGLLVFDKATGKTFVDPLPEGVDGHKLYPKTTGRNHMDEDDRKAMRDAIGTIPTNAKDYDARVARVKKAYGVPTTDTVMEKLGNGPDPYATDKPSKPSRESSGTIKPAAPAPSALPTSSKPVTPAISKRLGMIADELARAEAAGDVSHVEMLRREYANTLKHSAHIPVDTDPAGLAQNMARRGVLQR